jgi:gluconokinase
MVIVVMGVTGSGKTTVGRALAQALPCPFYDADDFHSPASIANMRAGIPLTDADRMPWLDRLRAVIDSTARAGTSAVLACSALRNAYRERLLPLDPTAASAVRFVYLSISPELVRARLLARRGHYMPASLVESQFAALEQPAPGDQRVLTLDARLPVEALVQTTLRELK